MNTFDLFVEPLLIVLILNHSSCYFKQKRDLEI